MSSTRRVARRSAMKESTADKENVAANDNCPADSKRYTNLKMKEEVKDEGSQKETEVKVEVKKAKARKRVGFVSSQPTEVLTFEKDEAPEINLASIVSRSSSRTAARVPISPIASKARKGDTMIVEEVLEWDEDDDEAGGMSCFSLHDLQGEVKITRDTEQMSMAELRRELQGRRKSTAGTKSELIQRLNRALKRAKDVEVMDD